ncbi:hypothetical protein ACHHYP_16688 [Achlya hypogyna]|uniref:Uncharacterized protein n=1 Tax=Achlya hypogyna TaxID=1202772 RepID=A0A1V9Y639_ACHHY|nr:hypothetical protein ACHHYP_16688 [Achlya hypogyna]
MNLEGAVAPRRVRRGSMLGLPVHRVHSDVESAPMSVPAMEQPSTEPTLLTPESPVEEAHEAQLVDALLVLNDPVESSRMPTPSTARSCKPNTAYARAKQRDRLNDYIKMSRHMVHKVKSGQSLERTIARQQNEMQSAKHKTSVALANACVSSVSDTSKHGPRCVELNMPVQFQSPHGTALGIDGDELILRHSDGHKKAHFRLRPGPWAKLTPEGGLPSEPVAIETAVGGLFLCSVPGPRLAVHVRPAPWRQDAQVTAEMFHHFKWHVRSVGKRKAAADGALVQLTQTHRFRRAGNAGVLYCLGHDLRLHADSGDLWSWRLKLPARGGRSSARAQSAPVIYPLSRPENRYRAWAATNETAIRQLRDAAAAHTLFDAHMTGEFQRLVLDNNPPPATDTDSGLGWSPEEPPDAPVDLNDAERLKLLQVHNPTVYGRLAPRVPPTTAAPRTTSYLRRPRRAGRRAP